MKKFLKSSLSLLLAIALVFGSAYVGLSELDFSGVFAVKASAADDGKYIFTLNEDGVSYSVTGYVSLVYGPQVIPETFNDLPVTAIGEYAFENNTNPTFFDIPDSVTSIGAYAFSGCRNLETISLPDSIKSIGAYAFLDCTSLVSITLPKNIASIDEGVFYSCESLKSVDISNGITSIEDQAFMFCTSLESIIIPDGVTSIGEDAFYFCLNLASVIIPGSVISIGGYAFSNCTSLTSITFPDGVTSIEEHVFSSCTSLESVVIGSSVSSININNFTKCENLRSIYVNENNEYFASKDGILFNKKKSELIRYPSGNGISSYYIPDGVTTIGDYAFSYCKNLANVTLPNSVTTIGDYAFNYCENLASVTLPDSVTTIGDLAFRGCKSLVSFTIPDETRIGAFVFDECTNLVAIYASGFNYTSIDGVLFNRDKSQLIKYPEGKTNTSYTIPDGVKYIGWNALAYCTNLSIVVIPDSVTWIKDGAFKYSKGITTITIPDSVTIIDREAFYSCTGLVEVITPCGSYASTFFDESILNLIHTIPNEWSVVTDATCTEDGLRYKECSGCGEIISSETIPAPGHSYSSEWTIDIEPTCTEEGSKSRHCTVCGDRIDVTVVDSLGHHYEVVSVMQEHPHTTIYGCSRCDSTTQETSYVINCALCNFTYTNIDSESCRITGYIGGETFFKLPGFVLDRVVVDTTTGAFKNNTTLKSVVIEDGAQGIGAIAFYGCTSLSEIVIPASVTSIGGKAFYNCASDFTIYCYRDTCAMQYAIDNSHNYVIMDIGETENCTIDYENDLIISSATGVTSIEDIVYVPNTSLAIAEASLISGNNEFLGTGSIVTVFDGDEISEYTVIINGDTNGDSVCDALDAAQVALASSRQGSFDGAYALAADSNSDDIVDINDYQAIVNKVVA